MPNDDYPEGPLAVLVTNRMHELRLGIKEVAIATTVSYEQIRKICKGESFTSPPVRQLLADVLQMDVKLLEEAAVQSRARQDKEQQLLAGRNPELYPIEDAWISLTKEQKASVIAVARGFASDNRRVTA